MTDPTTTSVDRATVEDFLYHEAELLSAARWDDWLELFVEGGRYEIPTFDAGDRGWNQAQYFIADDWDLLQARIIRMKSRNAHAENPRSLTHRVISNVRVTDDGPDRAAVAANFIVHRVRDEHLDPFVGRYEHLLALVDGRLRFELRRAVLLTEMLRPGTRLTFIL